MKKLSTFFTTLLVSVLLIGSTTLAQTTWNNGAGDGDWNNPLNWSAGLPTSGVDAIIDVSVAITAPTMSAAGACKSLSFTGVNAAYTGLVLNGKTLTVSGDVNLTGGRIVAGTGTISLTGSFTKGGGVFNVGTGTVIFAGTGLQTINDIVTFYNLTITTTGASARVIANAAVTVGNILTISGGAIFNDGGQTINLLGAGTPFVATGAFTSTGTVSYQGAGATDVTSATYKNLEISKSGVTFTAAGALSVNGNLSIGTGTTFVTGAFAHKLAGDLTNSGTFTSSGGSSMTLNGVTAQSIAGVTWVTLTNSNTTATVSLSSTAITTVTGTLTIAAGATLWDNSNQMGSVATLTNNGTLKLGGTSGTQLPVIGTAFTGGTGTVEFAASVAQTINDPAIGDYNNVLLSGAGTKFVATGNITVEGNLTISSGTTLNDNGKTIFLAGNWFNSGTYTTTGTLSFTGTAPHTIPADTYNNVTILANTYTANANFTVNGIFNIAGGTFVDGGKTISIGGTWTGTGGYTATGTVVFVGSGPQTISTAEGFNILTISSGTVTAQGALTVAGPLTIGSGATFVAGAFTHALSGGLSNSGTLTATGSIINFAATSTITANSATSFATANVTAGTVTLAGTNNITVATGMIVSTGATLVTGTNSVIGGGFFSNLGTLSFGNTAGITSAVQVSGAATFATTGSYVLTGTNQVTGSTGGAFPATVVDLTFAGSGTITLDKAVTLTGDLSLVSGNVGNGTNNLTIPDTKTITVTAGTLTTNPAAAGTYKLVYANTGEFTTGKEVPTGVATLSNLTTAAGRLNIGSATVVNGTLTLGGLVSTSANTLTVSSSGAAVAGVSATKYIDGKLGWGFAATTATTRVFPIGTGTIYRPVQMGLNATAATTVYVQMVNSSATALGLTLGAGLGGVSNVRYYETSQTNGAATLTGPTIKLHYDTDESVTDNANVVVAQNQAGTWTNIGGSPGTNPNVGDVITGATAYANTFGKFAIANASGGTNALAVELVSFTGTSKENTVSLTWTTATEHDNYGFNIERTVTGKSEWSEVGFVKGSGTSNSPKTYSFTDKVSGAASFDYRIKQTDVDGLSRYIGSVVTVTAPIPTEFALSQNYPNPFNPSTIIKYAIPQATFVTLKIYNMLGQEVATLVNGQTDIGFHSITWNGRTNAGSFASSGVYIYRIVAGDFVQVKKMNFLK